MHIMSSKRKKDVGVRSSVEPGHPLPSDPFPGSWKIWMLGMIVAVILPFWKNKWGSLQKFEKELERAEEVVEMVEKLAEDVENVADDIGDHLPEGTKLRKAALFVENVAKETVKDAKLAEQFINKQPSHHYHHRHLLHSPQILCFSRFFHPLRPTTKLSHSFFPLFSWESDGFDVANSGESESSMEFMSKPYEIRESLSNRLL
ncbi:hypothetical protein FNV43_RR11126 [Rhamnella rubrinervis]|uniref:Uncharacterized protein n=1 Tax=Rhamnella rubrinervis TaxID=2594499 RepID=A0A8K0H5J4_9ROSA|nr:hypothetical protein FNV43_RR11126 [Rhamnella rubrinervis]